MREFPLLLTGVGVFLMVMGIAWHFGSKYFPLGKLPGDFAIERENFRFYFPLATSIIISVVLTLIFWIILLLRR